MFFKILLIILACVVDITARVNSCCFIILLSTKLHFEYGPVPVKYLQRYLTERHRSNIGVKDVEKNVNVSFLVIGNHGLYSARCKRREWRVSNLFLPLKFFVIFI